MNLHSIRTSPIIAATMAAVLTLLGAVSTQAQGTAFTYQGRLDAGHTPATGLYDFEFHLYSAASGGGALTGGTAVFAHPVTNGLFTVTLDFLNSFPGADRWLEIAVKTNGAPIFNTLAPRQKLTPTPYAITAGNISGTLPSSGLSGAYNSQVTLFNPANQINGSFNGTFTGNGAGVSNVNAAQLNGLTSANFWQTNGNPNANPTNGAFVGTRDNFPLEVKVNGRRALRLEPNTNSPNVIGGHAANVVSPGAYAATIGGGGDGFYPNSVSASYGTVVGGGNNMASGVYATAGGAGNTASGPGSVALGRYNVSGGEYSAALGNSNTASGPSSIALGLNTRAGGEAAVAAGRSAVASGNSAVALGESATASGPLSLAAGWNARATASSSVSIGHVTTSDGSAAVALGNSTRAVGNASFAAGLATVAGGNSSTALGELTDASGAASTALGYGTRASGTYSTALGWGSEAAGNFSVASGYASKTAGEHSFAAGTRALATNEGTFVWADASAGLGTNQAFGSTRSNQFLIRARGGVGINTNRPQEAMHVAGRFLRVDGAENEAAYIGGDGAGGDVQVGSLNSNVNAVALYNATTGNYMNLFAQEGYFYGSIRVNGAFVGGDSGNVISNGVTGGFIGGGGAPGFPNRVGGDYATVAGGVDNVAARPFATVSGGKINRATGEEATVAGGAFNTASGFSSTIGGGGGNVVSGNWATIAGGRDNAAIGSDYVTIGGGIGNRVTNTPYATVAGGAQNRVEAGADFGTIGGGGGNVVLPAAHFATIPGGRQNSATNYAFAAGNRAKAIHPGAFVWSDTVDADFASTGQDQFLIRAGGGVGINTSNPNGAALAVNGNITTTGGLSLSDPNRSITFPEVAGANSAMINLFADGTGNADRMVLAHSPTFSNYGLQYRDSVDQFNFLGAGFPVLSVGLSSASVGINTSNPQSALDVNGTVTATTVNTPAVNAGALVVTNSLRVPGAGIGTTGPAFVHRVTAGNIDPSGNHRTTIDHPLCNGDANAILIITHNYNPGNTGGTLDTNPTSVYYNGALGKWQIYHDNLAAAPMTVGNAWNVLVFKP